MAIVIWGSGLIFWPVFQVIHRKWNLRAKRVFTVFLVSLGTLIGYLSLLIGPWRGNEAVAVALFVPITNIASLFVSTLVCIPSPAARLPRSIKWSTIAVAVLVCSQMGYMRFILDWQGQPVCHKNLESACESWMEDHNTNAFPNVQGVGRESLATLRDYYPGADLERRYGYVAGLHKDDPGELVLMYVNQPTRWVWHGVPRTIFTEKAWIIVPVDFTLNSYSGRDFTRLGECSETVSPDQLQVRLRKTIDFVRTNQRPNWQTVVAEQEKFLNSIKQDQ